MGKLQKTLLFLLIILTWGSIGSAILTLALLLALGYLLLNRFQETHDPDDFRWED